MTASNISIRGKSQPPAKIGLTRVWLVFALAALASFPARAQVSFLQQPVDLVTCANNSQPSITVTAEASQAYESWSLYYVPDTNSDNPERQTVELVASGEGPSFQSGHVGDVACQIPLSTYFSGSYQIYLYWITPVPGGQDGEDGEPPMSSWDEADSMTVSETFHVTIYPALPAPIIQPAPTVACAGTTVKLICSASYFGPLANVSSAWTKNNGTLALGGRLSSKMTHGYDNGAYIITNTLAISNVQASDGLFEGGTASYACTWTSPGCGGSSVSSGATLKVSGAPNIYFQSASPANALRVNTAQQGGATCLATSPDSNDQPLYQWQLQSGGSFNAIAGQTNSDLAFQDYPAANGTYAQSGTRVYRCEVINQCYIVDSDPITVSVGPPKIAAQPAPTNACVGDSLTLSVTANNPGPDVTYTWYGPQIGNTLPTYVTATNVFTKATTTTNDYGIWFCIVGNGAGYIQSSNAYVTVGTDPAITSDPQPVQVPTSGGVAVFQTAATGPNLKYSWLSRSGVTVTNGTYPNGTVVKGATTARLTLSSINANDVFGLYHARVTNSCGSDNSAEAKLTVTDCPIITQQPLNATGVQGENAVFALSAIGSPPPSYQWQALMTNGSYTNLSEGLGVSGALSNVLTVSNLTLSQPTNYLCILSNTCGTVVTSSVVNLTVVPVLIQPLLGPGPGTNTIVVPVSPGVAWTASCDASWLHLSVTNGTGSTNLLYTYDVNASLPLGGGLPPRSCTLTLAGIPIAVTQAGTFYQPAYGAEFGYATNRTGMGFNPSGVAVDPSGNVYMVDAGLGGGIWEWTPKDHLNLVLDHVSSTVGGPTAVAADRSGNVYFAQAGLSAEKLFEWDAAHNITNTLVSSNGLVNIVALAVDTPGNVYIAPSSGNQILMWSAATKTVAPLITNLFGIPVGVAVDLAGNVYTAYHTPVNQSGEVQIQVWNAATGNLTSLVGTDPGAHSKLIGQQFVTSIAVNGEGGVYFATTITGDGGALYYLDPVKPAASYSVSQTLVENLVTPSGLAVDASDNLLIVDSGLGRQTLFEAPHAFINQETRTVAAHNGYGSLNPVLPAATSLSGVFTPASDQPWLTITSVTNGIVNFSYTANTSGNDRVGHLTTLGIKSTITQKAAGYVLGANSLLQGPAAGSNCIVVGLTPPDAIGSYPWTATNNALWLHPAVTSGQGSTNLVFTFEANTNVTTRVGTMTIAGKTLTITQAGAGYVAAPAPVTTLVGSGLNKPGGVAVDAAGNVYIADTYNDVIKEWTPSNQVVATLVSVSRPSGLALDSAGDIYFADSQNQAVDEWMPGTANVTTVISSGLNAPGGIALDSANNIYVADQGDNAIYVQPSGTTVVNTVLAGLNAPLAGLDLDVAGDIFFSGNQRIKEWTAANSNVVNLVTSGLNSPQGVAVDGSGNVFIADTINSVIKEKSALTGNVTTIVSGLNWPSGVAVDGAGNLFIADTLNNAVEELPYAYVNATPVLLGAAAGSGTLPAVLPSTANLQGPFAPSSDSSWLSITSVSNGIVNYTFTANPGPYPRAGHLQVLGQLVPVTQYVYPTLATSSLVQGPSAGTSSIVLVSPGTPWTAVANAPWLHLSAANQSGFGSTNVVFAYDANPGATRSGVLTIGGNTLTVTQAGSAYVPAMPPATLVGSGLTTPQGIAVDRSGNVFIADPGAGAIDEWSPGNSTAIPIVFAGLSSPSGVAVDGTGNLFIVDTGNNTLKEWVASSNTIVTLVSSGLNAPSRIALDSFGNAYFTDANHNAVKEWIAANNTVMTLVSVGLNAPRGIAVDAAGNVYIGDTGNNATKEWIAGNGTVITLVGSGLNAPRDVAVDVSGNVYIADSGNNAIKEWIAASGSVVTLPLGGLSNPRGVEVDASGNVFVADTGNTAIKELPYAFVDPTPIQLPARRGARVVPLVLPSAQNLLSPYAPLSNQPWLFISLVQNGQVNFVYPCNFSRTNRTGAITILGQSIPITQAGLPLLSGPKKKDAKTFQLSFPNLDVSSTYTIIATTNVNLPLSNWMVLGRATNDGGLLQFIDTQATNPSLFYKVRSP